MKKLLVVMMAITALLCLTFAACGEIKDNGKEGGGEQTPATYTVTVSVSDAAYGTVSKTSIENVEKGTAVAVNGNVLTVGEETVTATATANTAEFTYAFTGFTGTAATVTGNIEITANFSRTVNKYTITFEMGDGTAIDPIEKDYGTPVSELDNVNVTAPTGYRFVKWQLKDGNNYVDFAGDETLERNITVKAVYEMDVYTVSIATNNAEYGTVSAASVVVPYGTAVTVNGATLTIGETVITATATVRDAQYTYAFTGFTGTAATVTGNMEFTANFTRVINQYVIVIDMDGGILSDGVNDDITSLTVDYGTDLSELDSLTKTRLGYTFEKWQYFNGENYVDLPAQMTVEFGFSIKAAWSVNTYTVSIAVNNADYGTVDVASVANVPYGTAITVEGNVITVGTTAITATKNNDDAQYTYEFAGFTGTVDTVTGNVEITANFTRETKTYTVSITVDNAEYGTVSTASVAVSYGTAISVEGNVITIGETEITATATIATAQYNYVFTGFTGTVDTVTGNVEITANFTRTINWNDISTTAEFVAMLSAAKAAASQDGGFTGYYRLTNDLDFTGVDVVSSLMLTNNQVTSKNWQATFDGQGYALSNIDFSWINNNGLFGEIGAGGVVKNVAIINPMSGENNKFNGYGGIIACNSAGLIENVYVKVASINDNALNGGLVRYCAAGSVLRNCVIEYAGGNLTNAALYVKTNGGASISNCYAITSATFPDSASGTTKESITALYDTENNGLTMLTKSESTLYWGSTALGEYVAIEWNDISTTDEFVSMLAAAKAAASQDGGFTGYYRLTQSLDFTGVNIAGNFMLTNNQVASKNWQATFDGQGYALSNLNYSWQNTNGLFGEIGTNGVIRNVAIINPEYSTTNEFKGYGGIIAWNNAGLIENVYVKINAMAENANNAGLVRYAMSGSIIRNCVVEYAGGNLSTAKLYVQSNGGATISNCYAVTTASFPDSAVGTTKATVAALYETENNGLTMLTKTNETYYWGNVAL